MGNEKMKHGETRRRAEGISMLNGARLLTKIICSMFIFLRRVSDWQTEGGPRWVGNERDTHTQAKVDSRQKWRR